MSVDNEDLQRDNSGQFHDSQKKQTRLIITLLNFHFNLWHCKQHKAGWGATRGCDVVIRYVASVRLSVSLYCPGSDFWKPWPRNWFWCILIHVEYLGEVRLSRSSGQGQGRHKRKACRYIFIIFTSRSNIKVMESRSRSYERNYTRISGFPAFHLKVIVYISWDW